MSDERRYNTQVDDHRFHAEVHGNGNAVNVQAISNGVPVWAWWIAMGGMALIIFFPGGAHGA